MPRVPKLCLVLVGLELAACEPRPPAIAKPESSAIANVESTTAVARPALTPEGWGPLRIGMSLEQVIAAAGEDANPRAVGGPDPESCDEFRPARAPAGLLVMIEDGYLTRISLGAGSAITTDRGFGIDARASEVASAYGTKALMSPHKYVDAPAVYITAWSVAPPHPGPRGVVYEVDAQGDVMRIHAGGASIAYVEGCL